MLADTFADGADVQDAAARDEQAIDDIRVVVQAKPEILDDGIDRESQSSVVDPIVDNVIEGEMLPLASGFPPQLFIDSFEADFDPKATIVSAVYK